MAPVVSADRDQKAALYQARTPSPQVVVLGSSRAKTIRPSCLQQLTGESGFNFAVNGAGSEDFLAILRFIRQSGPVPRQFLVGVEPEVLQGTDEIRRGLESSRTLAGFVTRRTAADRLAILGGDLFGWQAVGAGLQSVRSLAAVRDSLPPFSVGADGVQHYPWAEMQLRQGTFSQAALVAGSIPGVLARYQGFSSLDSGRVESLVQFLREARDQGIRVTGFIPPVHPAFARAAAATAWRERTAETVQLLHRLEGEGLLRYVETGDAIALVVDTTQYVDAVHFLGPVADLVASALSHTDRKSVV